MRGTAGEVEVMNNQEHEMLLEADVAYPLPGFHEQVVGMSPGEEKTFTLPVPEDDDNAEAAGQEATITVHLHTVKGQDVPPMDDELALMVGDYETLDDLKASVREELETSAQQKTESEYLDKALDAFIEAAVKVEYPPQAIDREAEFTLNRMQTNLASSGIELDTYLGMLGKTREMYKQEIRPAAEERLRRRLVLNEIAKLEELEVEPEEVEAEIERMGATLGPEADDFLETLRSTGGQLMITDDLRTAKAQERAVQIAKGEAPPLEGEVDEEKEEAEPEAEEELEPEAEAEVELEAASEAEAETDEGAETEPKAEVEDEPEAEAQAEPPAEGEEQPGDEAD
jgi:trigger factor